jgi:type VI secretion system protein ImpE
MTLDLAEQAVRQADLDAALHLLQTHVRTHPEDAAPRIFLFQLLAVSGQWDRARTQLDVAAGLDASALAMAQVYREALRCESERAQVFAGQAAPQLLGEPEAWLTLLIESLLTAADATPAASARSQALRERAFDAAPASAGSIDGVPFEWIADADMRLGPICEAVIDGRYYWVPFTQLTRIELEAPTDLRDVVWMPAHLTFANGGDAIAVIPTRYPGSADADDPRVRLGRRTEWREVVPDVFHGIGQRVWATDGGERGLMDVRTVVIDAAAIDQPDERAHA